MNNHVCRGAVGSVLAATLAIAGAFSATPSPAAQSVGVRQTTLNVQRALQRLPRYGVFDFLAFTVDQGIVTLMGYAYRPELKEEAAAALNGVSGVEEVANTIEILPSTPDDDRIRWQTFYNIYTDNFLSRYAPGGPMRAQSEAISASRFPGREPTGNYPIHIIVKNRRTILLGPVNSEADKTMAGVKARDVSGVFGVQNDLIVTK